MPDEGTVTAAGRRTRLAPRLRELFDHYAGLDVFRLEPDTVGVAGAEQMDRLLKARPATETERPTFKPLLGRSITPSRASTMMRAIGRDVRHALKERAPGTGDVDLSGSWPHVGHVFLRDLVLGSDPYRLRILMDTRLELTTKLTSSLIAVLAGLPGRTGRSGTALGAEVAKARGYQDRRFALGLYRRTAAPICFTISTLVANALWLGAPFEPGVANQHLLWEALRLLPPSWNLLRNASPGYPAIDPRIGERDDILLLPLLSHRDPRLWEAPEEFRPRRWEALDPEDTPGYLPFGHASERCWGRHMVMPLAELLLSLLRDGDYTVDPRQRTASVPLTGLLGVDDVRVLRPDVPPGR